MRRRISGSIFWGLVFVAFGSSDSCSQSGLSHLRYGRCLSRYWPVLLIVWGLFKLVDFFGAAADEKRPACFPAAMLRQSYS